LVQDCLRRLKISAARTIRPLWNHVDNNPDGKDNQGNRRRESSAGKTGASNAFR
jgi:hypothetical protein